MESQLLNTCKGLILERYPDLLAIYAFGSVGTEHFNSNSDVDLAILQDHDEKIDSYKLWEFAQKIACHIKRDVDLIDLSGASTVFRYQIISTGRRIFCTDAARCAETEVLYMTMYLNFEEERKELIEAFKRPA